MKKGSRHLLQGRPRGGPWEIFRFITEHANQFPTVRRAVEKMCKVLKVSSSGYYYWRKHPVGVRQLKQAQLLDHIREVHAQSESRYGSPGIADELRERGVKTSRNRVARLMHKAAIRSIMYKKYRVQTTDSSHNYPIAKNLLNREFTADKPGQKWVSDITYIPTREGWLYLTTVLDLADRKVIGWALSDGLKAADTSVAAWRMALKNRNIAGELLFHSDRGVQYACTEGASKGLARRTEHEP
ncbi:IS3 family transposase [Spirosoma pollinicola]|nr:IS3 family transposase [Spirosoma pollinicola]